MGSAYAPAANRGNNMGGKQQKRAALYLRVSTDHRFDVLMFWSIDRLGRSTAAVTAALEELAEAGVAIYADKEGMDTSTPHGRAMLQMAAVFAELERGMIRQRVHAGLARARAEGKRLGRPTISAESEAAIRDRLATGAGINKVARELGMANGTVHKVKRAMAQSVAAYP